MSRNLEDAVRTSKLEEYKMEPHTDPRMGPGKLIKLNNGNLIFAKTYTTNSREQAARILERGKVRAQIQLDPNDRHPEQHVEHHNPHNPEFKGLPKLYDYSFNIISGFCSQNYTITEFWDAKTNDLRTAIRARHEKKTHFTEEEMTYMLHNTVKGLASLNTSQLNHHNISPVHVDMGKMPSAKSSTLVDAGNPSSGLVEHLRNTLSRNGDVFAAPEVFHKLGAMSKGGAGAGHSIDPEKADAFALGMTLLKAGTMNNLNDCYDRKQGRFNEQALHQHMAKFRERYAGQEQPGLLVQSVEQLLRLNPVERWNARKLLSEFPPLREIDEWSAGDHHPAPAPVVHTKVHAPAPVTRVIRQSPVRAAPVTRVIRQSPVRAAPVTRVIRHSPVRAAPIRVSHVAAPVTRVVRHSPVRAAPVRTVAPVRTAPVHTVAPVRTVHATPTYTTNYVPTYTTSHVPSVRTSHVYHQPAPVHSYAPVHHTPTTTSTVVPSNRPRIVISDDSVPAQQPRTVQPAHTGHHHATATRVEPATEGEQRNDE